MKGNTLIRYLFTAVLFWLIPGWLNAASLSITDSTSTPINDRSCFSKTFTVTASGTVDNVTFQINIDHTYRDDLDITLSSPDGTTIDLTTNNGGSADNLYVLFTDSASTSITSDYNSHTSTVERRPEDSLSSFNGESIKGDWTLEVCDDYRGDTGTYNYGTLNITYTSTVNHAPTADDISTSTLKNESVDITLAGNDEDGDPLSYQIVQSPANGTVTISGDTATYTPDNNYVGDDSFTYIANDGTSDSNVATVSISVLDVVENAGDLCYETPYDYDGFCFDTGIVNFGFNCTVTITLKSLDDISDVKALVDTSGFFSGSLMDDCGVDGVSGNCANLSAIDFGPFSMFDSGIEYNVSTSMPADSTHSIYDHALIDMSFFSGDTLYGSYVKNNTLYRGKLTECASTPVTPPGDECGIFPSVLTSYTGIVTQKNDIINSCEISVANENLTEDTSGNNDLTCQTDVSGATCDCDPNTQTCSDNGTCTIVPEPDTKLQYDLYVTSITDSYTVDKNWNNDDDGATTVDGGRGVAITNITFQNLEYGNYTFTQDVERITLDPQETYQQSDTKVMLLGDFQFAGNGQELVMAGGDYYFKSFKVDKDTNGNINQLDLCPQDDIRIFVSGDFVFSGNNYDPADCGGKIFVYVQGDVIVDANGGGQATLPLFIYAEGDVTIENSGQSNTWFGSITAEGTIDIPGENINFEYDPDGFPGYGPCCIAVQFDKDHYDVREDINVIGTTKTVWPLIVLDEPLDYDVNVTYYTEDGTAKVADGDYIEVTGQVVTIPAGETNVSIPIHIYNDAPIELDEYFTVKLRDPSPDGQVCLGEQNQTQINILAQEDVPVCFEDDFNNGLDDKWRVLKADGGYTPQIVNVNGENRLRLTPAENYIATAVTKDYVFSTRLNLIIVEFDYYAYGGDYVSWAPNGADGIANVLFDSEVGGDSPEPGAMGGSLGYAQKDYTSDGAHPGFQGGWIGMGMDEFGNYSNPTEGRNGGPGFRENAVAIRGDGDYSYGNQYTYEQQGYEYLEGVQLNDTLHPLAKRSASDYYSGRYKMTVDARDPNHLYIRLERSLTGNDEDYEVIIDQFDAKDAQYNQDTNPDYIRYAITASTGAANNIHEIGWIKLRGSCAPYGLDTYTGTFDAWDKERGDTNGDGLIDDKNISAKIVGKPFELVIASLDETGTQYELKPGIDIRYTLYWDDENGNTYHETSIPWYDLNVTQVNATVQEFTVENARRRMYVRIQYCGEQNLSNGVIFAHPYADCDGQSDESAIEDNATAPDNGNYLRFHRSDYFAVRPEKFTLSLDQNMRAGSAYQLEAVANVYDSDEAAPAYDHNASISDTLSDSGKSCAIDGADLNVSQIEFTNGNAAPMIRFDDVGEINLTLVDTNWIDRGAGGDQECNSSADCLATYGSAGTDANNVYCCDIEGTLNNLIIIPHHFELNSTISNHRNGSFTYLSDLQSYEGQMGAQLFIALIPQNELNATTRNYTNGCFAKDILSLDVNFTTTDIIPANGLSQIGFYDLNRTRAQDVNVTLGSPSISLGVFGASLFTTPEANLSYSVNFDRQINIPVDPFDLNITYIAAKDADTVTESTTRQYHSGIARYYYAKAHPAEDYYQDVTGDDIQTPLSIRIFCDTNVTCSNFGIDTTADLTDESSWYFASQHRATQGDGNITLAIEMPLIEGIGNPTLNGTDSTGSVNFMIDTQGQEDNVVVAHNASQLPLTVGIRLIEDGDALAPPYTNGWLIHNPSGLTTTPDPFYKVRFIGIPEGWAGVGKTGHAVDFNTTSIKKSRRMNW